MQNRLDCSMEWWILPLWWGDEVLMTSSCTQMATGYLKILWALAISWEYVGTIRSTYHCLWMSKHSMITIMIKPPTLHRTRAMPPSGKVDTDVLIWKVARGHMSHGQYSKYGWWLLTMSYWSLLIWLTCPWNQIASVCIFPRVMTPLAD